MRPVARPAEHVDENRVVLAGADAPLGRPERTAAGAVDAFAVLLHPAADLPQPFDLARLDLAVGHRPDVEHEVAVVARVGHQQIDALLEALQLVVGFPGPLLADRHVAFPVDVAVAGEAAGLLLGRAEVADGAFRRGHAAVAEGPLLAQPVVDDDRRIELAEHGVDVPPALDRPVVFPLAVEPHHGRMVVLDDLAKLALHEGEVVVEVGVLGRPLVAGPARQVVGMIPVDDRVVGAEAEALPPAFVGQFPGHVALERRVHDVVVAQLRGVHREPVVVLGHQRDVLHARFLGQGHVLLGVELDRVELLVEVVVNLDRHLPAARPADLGALQAHRPPVDEHAEAGVDPPLHPLGFLGGRFGSPSRSDQEHTDNYERPPVASYTHGGLLLAGVY